MPYLRFSETAQQIFDEWRADLEHRLHDEDLPSSLQSHLSKYRSLIPSLALLIHLADTPEGGPISAEALGRACDWGEYLESHARRLYSPALDPALTAARELDRRILRGDLPAEFTSRDVYRKGWRLLNRESVGKAANVLADFNRVFRVETPSVVGRPTKSWRVNPELLEQKS